MDAIRNSSVRAWVTLVLLGVLGGSGLLLTQVPLRSPRPRADNMLWSEPDQFGRAPARLWQDPLQAAQQQYEELLANLPCTDVPDDDVPDAIDAHAGVLLDRLRTEIFDRAGLVGDDERGGVLILPIVISGDAWPSSEETRIGYRYAALSALGVLGYVPHDRENINYCILSRVREDTSDDMFSQRAALMPYEWLTRTAARGSAEPRPPEKRSKFGSVLVLWLRADRLRPGERLQHMERLLTQQLSVLEPDPGGVEGASRPIRGVDISVLGPNSSDMLVDMLVEDALVYAEGSSGKYGSPHRRLDGVHFLVWSATVSTDQLRAELTERLGIRNLLPDDAKEVTLVRQRSYRESRMIAAGLRAGGAGAQLHCGAMVPRTIGTDDKLAEEIVAELQRRRANPVDGSRFVALVHEWDTVYGRALPEILRQAGREASSDGTAWDDNVRTYTYLRGVDGAVPGLDPVGEVDTAKGRAASAMDSRSHGELPVGRSQLDYIRRVVDEIREDERRWRASGEGSLAAVGVLGQDVYDELLLLQALREAFPHVVFFTTDLQARFLHPSAYATARNLLIASHFDLRLGDWQGSTPPFRTSYQTALFYGAQVAVREQHLSLDGSLERPSYRMYEVARSGAYDLGLDNRTATAVYPASPRMRPRFQAALTIPGFLIASLSGMALAVFGVWSWVRARAEGTNEWAMLLAAGLGAVCCFLIMPLVLWLCFLRVARYFPAEEPFEWADGISVWPSVLVRGFVCVLCFWFMFRMYMDLRSNSEELAATYRLPAVKDRRDPIARSLVALRHVVIEFFSTRGPTRRESANWLGSRGILAWRPPPAHEPQRPMAAAAYEDHDALPYRWIDAKQVWTAYLDRGWPRDRLGRSCALLGIFLLFTIGLYMVFGWPSSPARGTVSWWVDTLFWIASFLLVNLLIFLVWDATRLCRRFILNLASDISLWGERTRQEVLRTRNLTGIAGAAWTDMQLIAGRTAATNKIIYYPFIVLLVLVIAINSRFDNWTWNVPAAVSMGVSSIIALVAATWLRRSAEMARDEAVSQLRREILRLSGAGTVDDPVVETKPGIESASSEVVANLEGEREAGGAVAVAAPARVAAPSREFDAEAQLTQVRAALEDILAMRTGAFAPFSHNPVVHAALIPFGGFGVLQLSEFASGIFG